LAGWRLHHGALPTRHKRSQMMGNSLIEVRLPGQPVVDARAAGARHRQAAGKIWPDQM